MKCRLNIVYLILKLHVWLSLAFDRIFGRAKKQTCMQDGNKTSMNRDFLSASEREWMTQKNRSSVNTWRTPSFQWHFNKWFNLQYVPNTVMCRHKMLLQGVKCFVSFRLASSKCYKIEFISVLNFMRAAQHRIKLRYRIPCMQKYSQSISSISESPTSQFTCCSALL